MRRREGVLGKARKEKVRKVGERGGGFSRCLVSFAFAGDCVHGCTAPPSKVAGTEKMGV